MNKILKIVSRFWLYAWLIRVLKQTKLKKRGVSLYQLAVIFIEKLSKDDIVQRGYAVAFNFTLSVFPFIIFLFTLIPYLPIINLNVKIMDFLAQVMPYSMYTEASATIKDIVNKPRGGLLSLGFVFALYLATNGMLALMKAFNKCYKTVEKRSFLKTRLIATMLTFVLAIIFLLSVGSLFAGEMTINYLFKHYWVNQDYIFYMIILLRLTIILSLFFLAISFIYYFAPAIQDRWRFFSPGSIIATLLSIAVSFGYSYYLNNFGAYNKLYGSIGALIGLMIWLFLLSVILLTGFELNASLDKATKMMKNSEGKHL